MLHWWWCSDLWGLCYRTRHVRTIILAYHVWSLIFSQCITKTRLEKSYQNQITSSLRCSKMTHNTCDFSRGQKRNQSFEQHGSLRHTYIVRWSYVSSNTPQHSKLTKPKKHREYCKKRTTIITCKLASLSSLTRERLLESWLISIFITSWWTYTLISGSWHHTSASIPTTRDWNYGNEIF